MEQEKKQYLFPFESQAWELPIIILLCVSFLDSNLLFIDTF